MVRPAVSEWEAVFGFTDDPTPGDTEMLGRLARSYRSVADDAGDALPTVSALKDKQVGEGKSMDKLRDKLGDLAKQVEKLHSSYDEAATALHTYVGQLTDHQDKADRALEKGRDARDRLTSATEAVRAAGAQISRLDAATPPPPDDEEARRSARRAMDEARNNQSVAQTHADDAQADLDAARLLAEDARELREADAAVAARKLDDARDDAVPGYSLWDKIKDAFMTALGFISAALGIIAMLIPGLQGIGVALAIGSFVTAAIPFGFNLAESIKTGEWDPLDMFLSGLGLVLGGFGLTKVANLGGIMGSLKSIPADINTVKTNISVSFSAFKSLPQAFKSPTAVTDLVANVLTKMPEGLTFRPPWKALPSISNFWTGKVAGGLEQLSNLLGMAGFGYAISAALPNGRTVTVHDDTYLPGTT